MNVRALIGFACTASLLVCQILHAAELVGVGNALQGHYRAPGEKSDIHRIVRFEDKLYIAHGGTDAKEQNLAIYLDAATWKFGCDKDDEGKPVQLDAEDIRWARVIEGALCFGNYDPVRGQRGAYHFRKRDGKWEALKCGPDGHHRDFFAFDGKLFTFDGTTEELPFPRIRMSADEGKTWSPVDASAAYTGRLRPGWEFFTFKGRLYGGYMAGRIQIPGHAMPARDDDDAPALILYTPKHDTLFEIAYPNTKSLFGDNDYRLIQHATEFKGRLFFDTPDLYVADSLAPDATVLQRIDIGPGASVIDIAIGNDALFALVRKNPGGPDAKAAPAYFVLRTDDGKSFATAAEFASPSKEAVDGQAFCVEGDQLVVGFKGGEVYRLDLAASLKPTSLPTGGEHAK